MAGASNAERSTLDLPLLDNKPRHTGRITSGPQRLNRKLSSIEGYALPSDNEGVFECRKARQDVRLAPCLEVMSQTYWRMYPGSS